MVAVAYLLMLALIFTAMTAVILRMVQGTPLIATTSRVREPLSSVVPPALLAIGVLVSGFYLPPTIRTLMDNAAVLIEIGG